MTVREYLLDDCRDCLKLRHSKSRTLMLSPLNLTDEQIDRECANTYCEEHKPWRMK